jgi:hypothetical protein
MKLIYIFLSGVFFITEIIHAQQPAAQFPEKMSYQAVIRDGSNNLVINQQIGIRLGVLQGSADGGEVYNETQNPTTNSNGLITIEIGGNEKFSLLDWTNGPYFLKTEVDPTGGTSYSITGTSQLLTVPYAFHAKTAEKVSGEPNLETGQRYGGGIIFYLTPDGKHGLIAETQDQGQFEGFDASDAVSNPENHSEEGKKYTDWRLPTLYELTLLYQQRDVVGGFINNGYWTSTEGSFDGYRIVQFPSGGTISIGKSYTFSVRAIRDF